MTATIPTQSTPPIPAISTVMEFVTPELARAYLACIPEGEQINRNLKEWRIEKLMWIILLGHWEVTHQGIGFDDQGMLIDGQHRLHAILRAGVGVWINVSRGMRRKAIEAIDDHARRTDGDISRIMKIGGSSIDFAIVRSMFEIQASTNKIPRQEIFRLLEIHKEAVEFAKIHPSSSVRTLNSAPVRAVIARAWHTADRDRLSCFLKVISDGLSSCQEDLAALTLRNWVIRTPNLTNGYVVRRTLYRKTENAARAFLEKRGLSRLYETEEELFPVPGEDQILKPRIRTIQPPLLGLAEIDETS